MSLGVGFAATTLSVVVSLLIGGVAGFVGGKLDLAVQLLLVVLHTRSALDYSS